MPAQSNGNGDHPLDSQSLEFVEALYEQFARDPASVSDDWRRIFADMQPPGSPGTSVRRGPSFRTRSLFNPGRSGEIPLSASERALTEVLQERVDQLVRNFRVRGHRAAQIDPLHQPLPHPPELDPAHYGFSEADLDRTFSKADGDRPRLRTLRDILTHLRNTYCRSIGVQFMHIDDLAVRQWLQERMERTENRITLGRQQQLRILERLTDAVVFEEFIQTKYLGAKSYSLEGGESLIPLLDLAIEKSAAQGVEEIVVAMAHRGRLNVLSNIIGKRPSQIFREFEDVDPERHLGVGDVKYHLGFSHDYITLAGSRVHLSLCFNPSHLEYVNPVALGRMRAKQDRFGDVERRRGMALLIHGDAAFCGEGVIQETLNLSELPGYSTGGSLHVIVNNQLGFTTLQDQGSSSTYVTDVARLLQSPIFHVNGENPEAVAQVVDLALEFRRQFQRDVFIDMYCYRRRGHNEGDEPTFTQPVMYRKIEQLPPVRQSYRDSLLELGEVTMEEAEAIAAWRRNHLEQELETARADEFAHPDLTPGGVWKGYFGGPVAQADTVETGVPKEQLAQLLLAQTRVPSDFRMHPKLKRAIARREEMAAGAAPLDWATAESLAFASLAVQGRRIRLSGQDVERGTFSQRHCVLHDYEDGHTFVPLQHLSEGQAPVEIVNSPLSEAGVLGFDYGYSLDWPDGLILWEAQFGDFANAAQVVFDQFIMSAEDKWRRLSGLVMLLPHGFEGQGPEHSSARVERFLTLAAEDNVQIIWPTTPAQYFHCLRLQALRRWRKPMIVFTPKSLLRHKSCVSSLDELASGHFRAVLPDETIKDPKAATRVLLCSGKIYYDLLEKRESLQRTDVAIVRLEQLYPFPTEELRTALQSYKEGTPCFWVQEEPENMGASRYMRIRLDAHVFGRLPFGSISRPESASPATGSKSTHEAEQEAVLNAAFADD